MRRGLLASVGLVVAAAFLTMFTWGTVARAQNAPIQATPLPPLQEQMPQPGAPSVPRAPFPQPSVAQTPDPQGPVSPGLPGQDVPGPGAQGESPPPPGAGPGQTPPGSPPVTPPATVERPNVWVPASVAKLEALDKVNAQATALTIKVGQSATYGSLTITVKACVVRPPDQPADAAAYLDVTDSHPDSPGFDGWMLKDEPSVSMMQHPIYDLRVTGCS
jgi:hypothetical protein